MTTVNAAIWVRVSTGGQDEQNQVPDLEHYCTANAYRVTKRYELHDKSAAEGEQQEALDQAIADAAKGKYQVLVVWAADRLERRGAEALFKDLRLFREAGARVESVLEPMLGADGLAGELLTAFTAIVAKAESAKRRERVRIGHDRVDSNGAFRGRIPFGYTTEGDRYEKHLVPTAEGRKYVPEVFRRVAEGEPVGAVAAWLTATAGPRTHKKKGKAADPVDWWPKSVAELVRRTVYFGIVTDSQGHETHHCERLVDMALWQAANDRLSQRPARGAGARVPAVLKGVLRCSACGGSMLRLDSGNDRKDGTHVPIWYYRCYGVPGPQRRCTADPALSVRLELADRAVDRFMTTALATVKVREYRLVPGKNYEADIKLIEWKLRELPRQGLGEDEEDRVRAGLRAERKRLKAETVEPDTWQPQETGETYGDVWKSLPEAERGAWLRRYRFVVTADRAGVSIRQEGGPWETEDWEALVPVLPKRDALKGSGPVGYRVEFADLSL